MFEEGPGYYGFDSGEFGEFVGSGPASFDLLAGLFGCIGHDFFLRGKSGVFPVRFFVAGLGSWVNSVGRWLVWL